MEEPWTEPRQEEVQEESALKVRCICGNQKADNQMYRCPDCLCYLHEKCLRECGLAKAQKCPFCSLTTDGIDPFSEMSEWIKQLDTGLHEVHRISAEIQSIEANIRQYQIHFPFVGQGSLEMYNRAAFNQLMNARRSNMAELCKTIQTIENLP